MALVKWRDDGNCIVVTIPADAVDKARLVEGDYIEIAVATSAPLVISPVAIAPSVRPEVRAAIEQVVTENRAVLDRLAAHDRGELGGNEWASRFHSASGNAAVRIGPEPSVPGRQ